MTFAPVITFFQVFIEAIQIPCSYITALFVMSIINIHYVLNNFQKSL